MAEHIGRPAPGPVAGFENIGKPVPVYRREAAYNTLKSIGVKNSATRWQAVASMADRLERDNPLGCVSEGMRVMDLTATYRVMAVLLTAPEPLEQKAEDGRAD